MVRAKLVKTRYIGRYDVSDVFLILKIYQRGNKFGYTVQDGDGPSGKEDTLVPWMESKFSFNSAKEAEDQAECDIADDEGNKIAEYIEYDWSTNIVLAETNYGELKISYNGYNGPWEYTPAIFREDAIEFFNKEVEKKKLA